jgi:hypothetical protein
MEYVGIDLHKRFLVVAVEDERGRPRKPSASSLNGSSSTRCGRIYWRASTT